MTAFQPISSTLLRGTLTIGLIASSTLFSSDLRAAETGFSFKDEPGVALDVLHDGTPVARYMYAHDSSSKERLLETYKPYLHVYDAEGQNFITKGAGGEFTHHRGIFIGWNRILFNGKRYDRWHMKGGEIVHQEFSKKMANKGGAMFTSVTHWNDEKGSPILEEHRTMGFVPGGDAGRLKIDFSSTLKAVAGDVVLQGDPEHAGVQYRPANEVDRKKTLHVFPKVDADPKKDLDYSWVGETYTLGDKQYSVVHMNHPKNPKGTKYSAYRDYGRFGAFFERPIKKGESLTVNYRFLIVDGEMPSAKTIQKVWDMMASTSAPSAVPQLSVIKQK